MVRHDAAEESIALAEAAGLRADPSQREVLRAWMGERADGSWVAFEACHVMSRQGGKGGELEIRQLGGLFVLEEELQLHTAHEFKTANEHFLRMAGLVEGCADLRRKVARIRYANGEQGIELRNGCRLKFLARSGGAGRGFAGASTVYYDEAMYLSASMVGASLPTMSTAWNPQVVYTGSAGLASSSQMHALRARARSGDGGRLAYVEHGAEFAPDGAQRDRATVDVMDRALWREANPAIEFGRISEEFVAAEARAMPRDEFLRERLGFWDPEPLTRGERVISEPDWLANVTDDPAGVVPVAFGLDVSPDRSTACIGAASGDGHIGVVDHRPGLGLGWLRDRVAELRAARPDAVWVIDGRSAANGLLDGEPVVLGAREMAAACGALYDAVLERRVRYRRQSSLEDAVAGAARRPLGDAWAWDRRESGADISPLVSVTLALAGVGAAVPEPVFSF